MFNEPNIDFTEDELALEFTEAHPNYRWVQGWGKWFLWTGALWRQDDTLCVWDQIRSFLRNASWADNRPQELRKARTVAAVERLARSDRRYAATVDQWDTDPMALNTPSGIVDLRTARVAAQDLAQYMTNITGCGADMDVADCPRWLDFLDDITEGDALLIDFLQRVIGYCLTGQTTEHALFFMHGTGANGKSTFLNVITKIFGDYATNAPMDTFTASSSDRHPTELAKLQGARLVTATETEEGRPWAESRIKQLTGGDPVTARFMRQDFFTFTPQFKLVIAGNHKPRLHTVDEAMRRRLHLIPFEASFKGEHRIQDMEVRLLEEAPAILKWIIDGCLEWQRHGLNPPKRVSEATKAYFSNQDIFGEWLMEACEYGPDFWERPRELFYSWREFAKDAHFQPGTRSTFNDRMETAGFHWFKDRDRGRHWVGLKLKPDLRAQDWAA